ncbi:unnamed protein product [Blepharisma stoltei]|uniref:mRNA cap guanine-N(7) methyltransferase n=1 Tax=Blepharisma stoltei TaxID=1481888 RepID=A0AAU9J6E7_9CILI|nr:unnamed protein product [Blepharisma stoltei]
MSRGHINPNFPRENTQKSSYEEDGSSGHKRQKTSEPNLNKEEEARNHYRDRRDIPATVSKIEGLRKFNNWIKSVLINEYTRQGFTVLDMCCGRGGDLLKFNSAKIAFYVGIDLSHESVEKAKERFDSISPKPKFEALLISGSSCDPDYTISQVVNQHYDLEYDLVSCQFAFHYIWDSEDSVRRFLYNVSEKLKPGAVFISTIPDANVVVKKLKTQSENFIFGNQYYSIKFDTDQFPKSKGEFGLKYGFYLEDSVGESIVRQEGTEIVYVSEYLVIMDKLEEIAEEYDLELVCKRNFHYFYDEYKEKYNWLLKKYLKSVSIDEDQWDIAYLYMVIVFKKKGEFKPPPKFSHADDTRATIVKMRDIDID